MGNESFKPSHRFLRENEMLVVAAVFRRRHLAG
jgi:hypothetical protein